MFAFERSSSSRIASRIGSEAAAEADGDEVFSLFSCANAGWMLKIAMTKATQICVAGRKREEPLLIALMALPPFPLMSFSDAESQAILRLPARSLASMTELIPAEA